MWHPELPNLLRVLPVPNQSLLLETGLKWFEIILVVEFRFSC